MNTLRKSSNMTTRLFCINEGSHSVALDPLDGSIWIVGEKSVGHFSSSGEKLGAHTGIYGRKWLALLSDAQPPM